MAWLKIDQGKSGKREVAVALLLLAAFLTLRHFIWVSPEVHAAQNTAWETLFTSTLLFAAAAYGIDFAAKAGMLGRIGPQITPETPPPSRRPRPQGRAAPLGTDEPNG